jgi:magnesium-transporting ATPase (P-type)
MVFMGTSVTYGRGAAVVTATGMQTELGTIAATLQDMRREATPLQRRLDALGRALAIAAVVIVCVIFAAVETEKWLLRFRRAAGTREELIRAGGVRGVFSTLIARAIPSVGKVWCESL